ncbi:hypothetical protein [Conchiformibius kuhniae]|uniref:Cysteine dioxygenase n=1 Tax=Conchiformibius kuhniae TaxID=211502 RepID=A0A8T9MX66_9NEIS|nr:hypothetical protein [Conchiformibius kuhniae]UOP05016.1 hypothetical protein LVJ77_01450 [Conchiformibius kuhniae]
MTQLAHLLQTYCTLPNIQTIIQTDILPSSSLLNALAARSYFHGNGFLKIVLLEHRCYKLRLHIWFPNAICEENIHNHCWHFASHILYGALKTELWQDVKHDTPCPHAVQMFDEYRYLAKTPNSPPTIKNLGQTQLFKQQDITHHAGESYTMPCNQLHRINKTSGNMVATIMCTVPVRKHNRLFPNGKSPEIVPTYLSAPELALYLQRFLSHVHTHHA